MKKNIKILIKIVILIIVIVVISIILPRFIVQKIKPSPKEITFTYECNQSQQSTEELSGGIFIAKASLTDCQKKEQERKKEITNYELKEEVDNIERIKNVIDEIPFANKIIDILRFNIKITNKSKVEFSITEPKHYFERDAEIRCDIDNQIEVFAYNQNIVFLQNSKFSDILLNYEIIKNTLGLCGIGSLFQFTNMASDNFILAPNAMLFMNPMEIYLIEFDTDKESQKLMSFIFIIILSIITGVIKIIPLFIRKIIIN
jgi:hypothetical protein